MRRRQAYQPPSTSINEQTYGPAFVRSVHELVALGYGRLAAADFAEAQEEEITGALVKAMEAVTDDSASPRWVRWYSVHEEPPVHDARRKGRRRLRVDIRIDSLQTRPRSRFPFEAKRLGRGHPASTYFGPDGLGRFLDGSYGREGTMGGMLGYVQTKDCDHWAAKLRICMSAGAKELRVVTGQGWVRERIIARLQHTYQSLHNRPSVGTAIRIYHCLLQFN